VRVAQNCTAIRMRQSAHMSATPAGPLMSDCGNPVDASRNVTTPSSPRARMPMGSASRPVTSAVKVLARRMKV